MADLTIWEKRVGRPPLREGEHTTPVSVRIPDPDYDELCRASTLMRVSVPDLIRRGVAIVIRSGVS
jgi:hypothetical protein